MSLAPIVTTVCISARMHGQQAHSDHQRPPLCFSGASSGGGTKLAIERAPRRDSRVSPSCGTYTSTGPPAYTNPRTETQTPGLARTHHTTQSTTRVPYRLCLWPRRRSGRRVVDAGADEAKGNVGEACGETQRGEALWGLPPPASWSSANADAGARGKTTGYDVPTPTEDE